LDINWYLNFSGEFARYYRAKAYLFNAGSFNRRFSGFMLSIALGLV
jgi:hypothetical protein